MPRVLSRATGHVPALLLVAGLLLVPAGALAQAHWTRISDPPDPPGFAEGAAVYDPIGDRVIVYKPFTTNTPSGNPQVSDEIWEFRLAAPDQGWHPLAVSGTGPGGRSESSAVFDAQGERMLLYGGWVPLGVGTMSNDIFVLSLAGPPAWSVIHADAVLPGAMPVRLGATMRLDETTRRLVVYGGTARFPDLYRQVRDLWTLPLDGPPTWRQIPITSGTVPLERYQAQFAWDAARARLLMHGGSNPAGGSFTDTWALILRSGSASASWEQLATTGPQVPRATGGAIVDAARDRLLLSPGSSGIYPTPASDLAVYELPLAAGGEWAPAAEASPFGPMDLLSVVGDSRGQRMLTVGNTYTQAYSMSDPSGWTRQWPPDPVREPGLYSGQVLVSDAEHRAIWWVGGSERGGFDNLWKLDVTAAAQWTWYPQPHELPYAGHGAALDADRGRVMVTSLALGSGEVIALGTDATPTETMWAPRDTFPAGRTDYSAVVDPVRRRLLLFGGNTYPGYSFGYSEDDLWSISLDDPSAWTLLAPTGSRPSARQHQFAFYDDVHDRMVMFGGVQQSGGPIRRSQRDAWSLALAGAPAWTALDATAWLPPAEGSVTYDPVVRRLFLFHAPTDGSPTATQVWMRGIADGDRWTQVATSGEAPTTSGPVVFAPWSDRLVATNTTHTGPMPDETWALQLEHIPVTNATLESTQATNARVILRWRLDGAAAAPLTVAKRVGESPWQVVAHPLPDDHGLVAFEDVGVSPGTEVSYRLNEGARTLFRTDVPVPHATPLAFTAARPSPAHGVLNLVYALPAASPVRLELYDVRGARVLARDLGMQLEGEHSWTWAETASLRPGLYMARLSALGTERVSKALLLP